MTYERLQASSAVAVDTSSDDALMEFSPEDHSTVRRRPHTDANALLAFSSEERVQPRKGSRPHGQATPIDRRRLTPSVVAFLCGIAVGALVMLFLVMARATV